MEYGAIDLHKQVAEHAEKANPLIVLFCKLGVLCALPRSVRDRRHDLEALSGLLLVDRS
jgi:hypothetical protein